MALPQPTDNQHTRGTSSLDESVSVHQWETAILKIMTSNANRIAIIEKDLSKTKSDITDIKNSVKQIENSLSNKNGSFNQNKEILYTVKSTLKMYVWIRNISLLITLLLIINIIK